MSEPSVSLTTIYQLRVVLCAVSPLVWRRLLVASGAQLAVSNDVLFRFLAMQRQNMASARRRLDFDGCVWWLDVSEGSGHAAVGSDDLCVDPSAFVFIGRTRTIDA